MTDTVIMDVSSKSKGNGNMYNFLWQVRRFSGYVFFGLIIALLFVFAITKNGIGIAEIIFSLILVALFAYNFTFKKKGD